MGESLSNWRDHSSAPVPSPLPLSLQTQLHPTRLPLKTPEPWCPKTLDLLPTPPYSETMFDSNGRVDIPRIMKGLSGTADMASQQNAAAALGYIACRSEEYRDAIAAQLESIITPLLAHLQSGQTDLIHNAAVLLGLCCASGSEFRQSLGQANGVSMMVSVGLLPSQDSGILTNVLFALRQYVGDTECPLDATLRLDISNALPELLAHENPRIALNTKMLQNLLEQRPLEPPPVTTTMLRRDESLEAAGALAKLATTDVADNQPTDILAWSIKLLEENSPTGSAGSEKMPDSSPAKRRHSLLSPWKNQNRSVAPTVKTSPTDRPKRLQKRKVVHRASEGVA